MTCLRSSAARAAHLDRRRRSASRFHVAKIGVVFLRQLRRYEDPVLPAGIGRRTWPRRCAVAFASIVSNTGSRSTGELDDDLEYFRGRGLLLQRLGQIVGALAQFVEQPRVLDGDDGLRGEVLHQLDLFVGERANLLAKDVITPTSSFSLASAR